MKRLLLSASLLGLAAPSHAAVVAFTWEDNGHLETVYSGTLDLSGLSYAQGRSQYAYSFIRPDRSFYFNMFDYQGHWDGVLSVSGPGTSGSSLQLSPLNSSFAHTRFGDQFGYGVTSGNSRGAAVYTAYNYVNGASIEGGSTSYNTSLADLGLTGPATVSVTWGTDSITHYYGVAPVVPLPAGLPLLAAGLGMFAWMRLKA